MINLLPAQQKKELLEEENFRLILILGTVLFISLFCLILILFSIKIYLSGQVESQRVVLSQVEKEFAQSGLKNLQEKIKSTNLTFSQLHSFYQKKFYLTEILERISKTLPPGTYLTNFSFSPPREEFPAQISLSGFAQTREILIELKRNLEAEEDFQEIYFPPENWVQPTDINFSLTFKLK